MEKITPFTFINAINDAKDIEVASEYSAYLVNRQFSLFHDTILIANHANGMQQIDRELHFKYYRNMVSKRKRFTKWPKGDSIDLINMIADYFDFSMEKAVEALKILTEEQIGHIKGWSKQNAK